MTISLRVMLSNIKLASSCISIFYENQYIFLSKHIIFVVIAILPSSYKLHDHKLNIYSYSPSYI